ncbi:MAG: hypothetical protein IKP32_09610 [Clostridia bacterium]|nr:hypothetical protein [Clostridia bacterium]
MKRFFVLLLAAMLLTGCVSAAADVDDWALYESEMGYTMLYPDFLLEVRCVPSAETGLDAELFVPLEEDGAASMRCRQADDPDDSDWEDRGYRPMEMDEPDFEMYVPMEMRTALYLSPDGEEMVEEIRLESPVSMEAFPAGFEYVFDIRFPAEDQEDWRGIFECMLETLEFQPQPAEAGSFRLDFFSGGAAGMRFTPVVVDEDAEPLVLTPRANVTGFVLEKLDWDDDTFSVAGAEPLYAANILTPADHLEIFCWFSDVLPDLRVRCLNESGEAECWYLFQSGMDGSLLLLSEEEALPDPDAWD